MGVCCSCTRKKSAVNHPYSAPKLAKDPTTYGCALEKEEREAIKTDLPLQDICYIKMANTISNIKMTNPIKNLVSKRRKRYIQDGYNLDLTYIRDNLIAMGFPAEKLEGVYRNHIDDVVKFLECKHKDHYKIYNLCSERSYDINKFQARVANYPFDDHNPPKIELIRPFCADVDEWLLQDPDNVAAVHCKAGKGRTGVMICCYMLHARQFSNADEALGFYGQMRTHDRKGVTIPSQRRYVAYYAELLQERLKYEPTTILIREIRLEPQPLLASQAALQFTIYNSQSRIYVSPVIDMKRNLQSHRFTIDEHLWLTGDIKVEFFNKPKMKRKEKLFHFWFNTFFVREAAPIEHCMNGNESSASERSGRALSCDATGRPVGQRTARAASLAAIDTDPRALVLNLHKPELDNAHKDKQHKLYPPDFRVSLYFHKVPLHTENTPRPVPQPQPTTTPSESSEADSSDCSTPEEDGWDSAACLNSASRKQSWLFNQ